MIELRQLTKRYGDRVVVDGVSLDVARGELLVLLGASGSGKTTTLKMINRLVEPSAGQVLLDGSDAAAMAPHELRRRIGYAFQQIGLFPHLTIAQNVGITPRLLGWSPERIARRVDELLDLVELAPATFRDRRPAELSGGQQQRVGVARALAAEPAVLLFDEPFGALDPLTRDRLQQSLRAIRARVDVTIVFVTHDMVEALLLGDRIAVMRDGRLVQVGTPADLLRAPAGEYVAQLMETPLRHGRTVEALARGETPDGR
ncbi:MAG TPA: ABC transporter ATP-binding protein [Candidatus Binatia bacterium]